MPIPKPSSREDFKIVIICALKLEAKAVLPLFDTTYDENLDEYRKLDEDENAYVLGSIGKYHVVLVVLPGEGKAHASFVSSAAKRSYPGLELALVVGVCGGVPYATDPMSPRRDIYLGDVIVSNGVVQHDLGRRYDGDFVRKDTVHSNLGRPSRRILAFVNKLDLVYDQLAERLASYLLKVQGKFPSVCPGAENDQLFRSDYAHLQVNCRCSEIPCGDDTIVARRRDPSQYCQATSVHFGLVASGDTVMKSAQRRDEISANESIIAFEMEGAGVWDNIPCIVVKGVCDYSDSHKNKDWQFFAAATAAACARAILDEVPVSLPKPSVESSNSMYTFHRLRLIQSGCMVTYEVDRS